MPLKCEPITFRDRKAICLQSDTLQAIALTGGGHLASLCIPEVDANPMWEPPWASIEPEDWDRDKHVATYGPGEGRLLASLAGHSLCLNHFGDLTEAEIEADGYFHGEASNLPWTVFEQQAGGGEVRLEYGLELPEARMRFKRTLRIRDGESTIYFTETTTNLTRIDSPFCCQQHVTLGPPFVESGVTRVDLPAQRGQTNPVIIHDTDPMKADQTYQWPHAPLRAGGSRDLRIYPEDKCMAVVSVLLEPEEEFAYAAVSNPRLGLLLVYAFPREVFPWTALWYEHEAAEFLPYNNRTTTWGVEFGSVAQAIGFMENLTAGPLLGHPRCGILPALQTIEINYQAHLIQIPSDWQGVGRIEHDGNDTIAWEAGGDRSARTPCEWSVSPQTGVR